MQCSASTKWRFDDPREVRAVHKFDQAGSHGMTMHRQEGVRNISSTDYINMIMPESEPASPSAVVVIDSPGHPGP
jgi:hypothetical protein